MAENETVFEEISRDLLHFISKSPSPFHAARGIKAAFVYDRASELREEDDWEIEPGHKYVVTRNGSAVIAFTIPEGEVRDFRIIAAHSDSPRSASRKIRRSATARTCASMWSSTAA